MVEELLIIGAGGSSRELVDVVNDINRREPRWKVIGFLDDTPAKQKTSVDGLPVLGPLESIGRYSAQVIVGIAHWKNVGARRPIVERLALPEERYATLAHPSASISSRATIGRGTAIMHNVVITSGVVVGNHTLIMQNGTVAHDSIIEDFVIIAPAATITGYVRLRSGSYVGAGCTILPAVTVNEGALAGIGSVVMNDIPAGRTVSGNPARLIIKQ